MGDGDEERFVRGADRLTPLRDTPAVPGLTGRAWSLGQGATIRAPQYRAVNSEQGGQAADHSRFTRARIMKVPYGPDEPSGVLSLHLPGVTGSVFPGS